MVPVSRPMLELVRERIEAGLAEARRMPLLCHLGAWLRVFDETEPWTRPDGLRHYRDVAEAGAVLAVRGHEGAGAFFDEGVAWLRQRRFFVPAQPAGLEADPVAFVALAVGLDARKGEEAASTWLADLATEALKSETDPRRMDLLRLALVVAHGSDESRWGALSPVAQVAVGAQMARAPTPEVRQRALAAILDAGTLEPESALLQAAALDALFTMEAAIDLAQPSITQVIDLLRRVPAALKRWPWEKKPKTKHTSVTAQRWDIQHEYHVQSLLWSLLRPVFPGLEDEESLPSLGHKHPRADLLVPSLRVVIEVKYLREATQSSRARIIEEVAADVGLYLTDDSGFDRIVAFIWDDSASTNHHDEIVAGIRKLRGIAEVVIVSRPGEWTRETP